jgi:hypothetical protein
LEMHWSLLAIPFGTIFAPARPAIVAPAVLAGA